MKKIEKTGQYRKAIYDYVEEGGFNRIEHGTEKLKKLINNYVDVLIENNIRQHQTRKFIHTMICTKCFKEERINGRDIKHLRKQGIIKKSTEYK